MSTRIEEAKEELVAYRRQLDALKERHRLMGDRIERMEGLIDKAWGAVVAAEEATEGEG